MNPRLSPTLAIAQAVDRRRSLGEKAWSLSSPSFPVPEKLPDISGDWFKLSEPAGIPELRKKAQDAFFGKWIAPQHQCIVTAGAKAAIFSIFKTITNTGDTVIIPQPAWPSYIDLALAAGAKPITIKRLTDSFCIDILELKTLVETRRPKAIIISNPCNPTGRITPRSELKELVKICNIFDLYLIIDQSFSSIVFDHNSWKTSVITDVRKLILVDSFSKNFLMQGARVAATLVPNDISEHVIRMHETFMSSAPTPAQKIALWAMEWENSMPDLSQQRNLAKRFILEMNWSSYPQQGTFYFFPKIPNMEEFSKRAKDNGIFLLQGDAFGAGYKDHFRLCFGKSVDELKTIFTKLSDKLK